MALMVSGVRAFERQLLTDYDIQHFALERSRLKLDVLQLVFKDPTTDFDGGMDAAREMWAFVRDV
jgi:hypothetical protein